MKEQRKLHCSKNVVEPNCGFLLKIFFGLEEGVLKQQVSFLVDTSYLMQEHINSISILHFQQCRCACFIDWLLIKSDQPHGQMLSFTKGFHQFTKQYIPLNFKLHHKTILPHHLQINMITILSLGSFLYFIVGHVMCQRVLSCCFIKR